ncbi:hypothetical protein B0T11DRAFT_83257 [Plectosphaerella cucumerina]|uniref:Uncharacterized protein n=1 Tax=Plectosphaerella cucumerina TaxID=40658 RepID=A0A8K0X347_9PEZI|nr:hypothetical protein B0T11DRAFT_83257 [Plectosphaerella cucumerina]
MLSSTRLALFNRDRPLTPPNNRQSRRPPRRLRHGSQWKSHNSMRERRSGVRQFVQVRRRFWRLLSATTLARNINTGSNVRPFPAIDIQHHPTSTRRARYHQDRPPSPEASLCQRVLWRSYQNGCLPARSTRTTWRSYFCFDQCDRRRIPSRLGVGYGGTRITILDQGPQPPHPSGCAARVKPTNCIGRLLCRLVGKSEEAGSAFRSAVHLPCNPPPDVTLRHVEQQRALAARQSRNALSLWAAFRQAAVSRGIGSIFTIPVARISF